MVNMLGLNNNKYDENIKNPPSDDSYPMVSILFSKNNGIGVNALSLTILDLINKDQIKCDIDLDDSHEVGKKKANAWGLYDMHGNILEWCLDSTSGEPYGSEAVTDPVGTTGPYKIARGSAWNYDSTTCRSAHRFGANPSKSSNFIGFRLAIVKF